LNKLTSAAIMSVNLMLKLMTFLGLKELKVFFVWMSQGFKVDRKLLQRCWHVWTTVQENRPA